MQTTPTATDITAAVSAPTEAKRCIKRLRSRFERWELTHLRDLAANLHEQLQEAEQRANDADRRADMFMDMNHSMEEELGRCGKHIGITQRGELVLVPVRVICNDFGDLVEVAAA